MVAETLRRKTRPCTLRGRAVCIKYEPCERIKNNIATSISLLRYWVQHHTAGGGTGI